MPKRRRSTSRAVLILALVAIWVFAAAPGASAASATGKNVQLPAGKSISGKITKRVGGAALANAYVYATSTTGGSSESDYTDASGNYTIIALEPGSYKLYVYAPFSEPDLLDGYYKSGVTGNFTFDSTAATVVTITTANVTGKNVSLPGGYIIKGTVQTSGGNPLQNVSVYAFGPSGAFGSTDATGKFEIHGLRSGTYNVQVSPLASTNFQRGYYRSGVSNHFTPTFSSASDVVLGTTTLTLLTIKLPTGYKITGKLTTSAGTALNGASVSAYGPSSGYDSTDASGNFTIQGLSNGSYQVSVSPPFDRNLMDGYYRSGVTSHFTTSSSAASAVVISGANKTTGTIKLPTAYKVTVIIKTSGGAALPDADANVIGPDFAGESTDATGKAVMDGLEPGTYYIAVSPPFNANYQSGYYRTGVTSHFTVLSSAKTNIVLDSTHTSVTVTINLPVGAKISGKITKSGGAAVSGACVSAVNANYGGSDCTGTDGTYSIIGLAAGTYKLQVSAPYSQNLQSGWYIASGTTHFTVSAASASGVAVSP